MDSHRRSRRVQATRVLHATADQEQQNRGSAVHRTRTELNKSTQLHDAFIGRARRLRDYRLAAAKLVLG